MEDIFAGKDIFEERARQIDRLWERFLHGTVFHSSREQWQPAVDVYELEDEIQVLVDLAGVRRERVEVVLDGQTLQIRGWREDPAPRERVRLHQIEIDHGYFERVLHVEMPVDRSGIEAVYRDGFLRIRLPKSEDEGRFDVEIQTPSEDEPEVGNEQS